MCFPCGWSGLFPSSAEVSCWGGAPPTDDQSQGQAAGGAAGGSASGPINTQPTAGSSGGFKVTLGWGGDESALGVVSQGVELAETILASGRAQRGLAACYQNMNPCCGNACGCPGCGCPGCGCPDGKGGCGAFGHCLCACFNGLCLNGAGDSESGAITALAKLAIDLDKRYGPIALSLGQKSCGISLPERACLGLGLAEGETELLETKCKEACLGLLEGAARVKQELVVSAMKRVCCRTDWEVFAQSCGVGFAAGSPSDGSEEQVWILGGALGGPNPGQRSASSFDSERLLESLSELIVVTPSGKKGPLGVGSAEELLTCVCSILCGMVKCQVPWMKDVGSEPCISVESLYDILALCLWKCNLKLSCVGEKGECSTDCKCNQEGKQKEKIKKIFEDSASRSKKPEGTTRPGSKKFGDLVHRHMKDLKQIVQREGKSEAEKIQKSKERQNKLLGVSQKVDLSKRRSLGGARSISSSSGGGETEICLTSLNFTPGTGSGPKGLAARFLHEKGGATPLLGRQKDKEDQEDEEDS